MILVLLQPSMKRDAIIKYANAIKLSGMKGCFSTYLLPLYEYISSPRSELLRSSFPNLRPTPTLVFVNNND